MLKNLLLLSGFSAFVAIIIIATNISLSQKKTTIPASIQEIITPISDSFDTQTFDELKNRSTIPVNLQEKSQIEKSDSKEAEKATGSAKSSINVSPTRSILP